LIEIDNDLGFACKNIIRSCP